MSILTTLRDRYSPRDSSGSQSSNSKGDSGGEPQRPFEGYDRLDARQVMDGLCKHSQVDLEAIESYERSQQSRDAVLLKLRYMRGREPLSGYDALSAEEVVTALGEADMTTIKGIRAYERKFANRASVMDEVVRVHHVRLAAQQASSPAGEPASATAGATPSGDGTESGRP